MTKAKFRVSGAADRKPAAEGLWAFLTPAAEGVSSACSPPRLRGESEAGAALGPEDG